MDLEIKIRNIAPISVIVKTEFCTHQNLYHTIQAFPSQLKKRPTESFVCKLRTMDIQADTELEVFSTTEKAEKFDDTEQYYKTIMQRTNVVSTVLMVPYDEIDKNLVFQQLQKYIDDNNLTSLQIYRIVFHKEKRKWQRSRFLKRSKKDVITEFQIEIE